MYLVGLLLLITQDILPSLIQVADDRNGHIGLDPFEQPSCGVVSSGTIAFATCHCILVCHHLCA